MTKHLLQQGRVLGLVFAKLTSSVWVFKNRLQLFMNPYVPDEMLLNCLNIIVNFYLCCENVEQKGEGVIYASQSSEKAPKVHTLFC